MTLASAIAALSPQLWWKLDEPAGSTTVHDSGSYAFDGTVSGDLSLGVHGPEEGTTAVRIYTSGTINSPAFGWGSWPAFTVAGMFSIPATVPSPSPAWFWGLGDKLNPLTRGCVVGQSTGSGHAGSLSARGSGLTNTTSVPYPENGWHHFALTYSPSPLARLLYIDGSPSTSVGANPGVVPQPTDPWWINSPWPIILAHMTWWSRALTQTEIQTITSQIPAWPYQTPMNVPYPATTTDTGGLTEEQAAQLTQVETNTNVMVPQTTQIPTILGQTTDIQPKVTAIQTTTTATHTDTQNIVNVLFPQLETPLNYIQSTVTDILNGITTTITTAAGSVAQSLGDFFAQHSKDQFGLFNVTGGPTCDRIDWVAGAAAYWGVTVNITSWPSEWTFTTPDDQWSIRDMAVLTIKHGTEQEVRHGIHTRSFTLSPLPASFPLGVSGVGVPILPPDYHIIVDWAGGVCGELLLHYLP